MAVIEYDENHEQQEHGKQEQTYFQHSPVQSPSLVEAERSESV